MVAGRFSDAFRSPDGFSGEMGTRDAAEIKRVVRRVGIYR
jgi:hypothetical protein